MILAYHAIFTAYGFWLPNDPRGSWSDFVASWEILRYGEPVPANTRRSLARREHDSLRRLSAKSALLRPPVTFNGLQAREIAHGFSDAIDASGYEILACAIMEDHVHAVARRHSQTIERIVGHLKARASRRLLGANLHPFGADRNTAGETPSPWAEKCWKVFLDSPSGIDKAVRYTKDNPRREGLPAQNWYFLHSNHQRHTAAKAAG